MQVEMVKDVHKISLKDISSELAKLPFKRFEYGDFDNWVNAYMVDMKIYRVEDLRAANPNAMYHYSITIEDTFRYIRRDGTVSDREDVGYATYYVNDKDSAFIEIDGYVREKEIK